MTTNTYDGLIDPWKMEIVSAIALRMGLRPSEIDDAQQEVAVQLLKRSYDKQKSNGASEATLVGIIARNVIQKMRRGALRYADLMERARVAEPPAIESEDPDRDLGEVWTVLDAERPECRQVAALLAQGLDLNGIARQLGWKWDRVERVVVELRRILRCAGFAPA